MKIGPEVVNGDMMSTIAWVVSGLLRAGDSAEIHGVVITARLGFEYDVDGEVVASKDVREHVRGKLAARVAAAAQQEAPRAELETGRVDASAASERARCLEIVDAVGAVSAAYAPRWATSEIRRRILEQPAETLTSHAAEAGRLDIGHYAMTGKRHNA